MIFSSERVVYVKRLPTFIDRTWEIQAYDRDNLYPQRLDEIRKRSFTLKSAIDKTKEFIVGEGWQDQVLAKTIFNTEGLTGNDILEHIAGDKACLGFSLHFTYNPFTYRIMEITPVKFMYSRFGIPDENGNVCDIAYSRNWEQDPYKELDNTMKIDFYPVFDPNPEVVKAQIAEYGFECYPGQLLYWTPETGVYPEATFDAVADNAQTQSEVGVYQLATIQNDFGIEKIFKYPGEFPNKKAKEDFKEDLSPMKGAKGAKSTLIVEVPDGTSVPAGGLIESIQMQNTDKMYEFTAKDTRNAIREGLSVPAAILGQLPETGMFNQEQITDSFNYFNAVTRNHRNQISRVFERIMRYWHQPLTITSFKITPKKYLDDVEALPGEAPVPGQPGNVPQGTLAASPRPEMNEALSKLDGKQNMNLDRIIRQYDSGKLTYDRALRKITMTYPITEEEAIGLLGENDG